MGKAVAQAVNALQTTVMLMHTAFVHLVLVAKLPQVGKDQIVMG